MAEEDLRAKIEELASAFEELKQLAPEVELLRHDARQFRTDVASRFDELELRIAAAIQRPRRFDSGIRALSEADAKLASDQAAMQKAVEETAASAKIASQVAAASFKKLDELSKRTDELAKETKAQTPMIQQAGDDAAAKAAKTPTRVAVVSLISTLAYIFLEILKRLGH